MMLDFYRGKRVFITGHTGFKGSWLSQILLLAGANVTGYSLQPPTNPSLFEQLELSIKIEHIIGDIRDLDTLKKALQKSQPDIIFHLAAQPLVLDSYRDPVTTYATNVMGTVNILQAAREIKSVRSIVNITTDKVYENKEWPWGYRENERLDGFDPYSNSKSCSELVTASYRRSFYNEENSPALSTARAGNVIGGGDYSDNRIIPDCVHAVASNTPLIIRHAGSIRPYQHVLDCLNGYLTLGAMQSSNKKIIGSYNFGPDDKDCASTLQLVKLFQKHWGDDFTYKAIESDGPHEANFLKLDHTLATNVLDWRPHWDINVAVEKVTEFARCQTNPERQRCVEKQIKSFYSEEEI